MISLWYDIADFRPKSQRRSNNRKLWKQAHVNSTTSKISLVKLKPKHHLPISPKWRKLIFDYKIYFCLPLTNFHQNCFKPLENWIESCYLTNKFNKKHALFCDQLLSCVLLTRYGIWQKTIKINTHNKNTNSAFYAKSTRLNQNSYFHRFCNFSE